jgi:hypothetical protein
VPVPTPASPESSAVALDHPRSTTGPVDEVGDQARHRAAHLALDRVGAKRHRWLGRQIVWLGGTQRSFCAAHLHASHSRSHTTGLRGQPQQTKGRLA